MNTDYDYNEVMDSFEALLKQARYDSGSSVKIRNFLFSIWKDEPFQISFMAYLDTNNTNHVLNVLNWHIKNQFSFPSDFEYADEMRALVVREYERRGEA
ncbi:DUF7673 family protein [Neokomagataea tanensis]|nr:MULTISPECIES: hypothetical protein [Neokomagataea]